MKNFWDSFETLYQHGRQKHRLYMLDLLRKKGVESLLDVGCGSGPIYEILKEDNDPMQYKGVDYSTALIELAHENFPEGNFKEQDMRNLTEANDSWDCVLLMHALDHTNDYKAAIKEAARVCKRYVCIILWRSFTQEGTNINTDYDYGFTEDEKARGEKWDEPNHLQEYSREALEAAFKEAGLKIEEIAEGEQLNGDYSHYNFLFLCAKST